MRIRTIKPEFFVHEALYVAEAETKLPIRLAFSGLWCAADREGRFKWEPRRLGVQILPYDGIDFSRVLDALTTRAFVEKYTVKGVSYGYIPSFLKHQVVNNREKASEIPPPETNEPISLGNPRVEHASATREAHVEHACKAEGKGKEGKGTSAVEASPWEVAFGLELPETLRTPECLEAATTWLRYKSEHRESYKPTGLQAALTKWANEFTADEFPKVVQHSMASGWKGIFPSDTKQAANRKQAAPTDADWKETL